MNPFYLCTIGKCNCLASKKIEKAVITSPPDGMPILSQFGAEFPRMDRFGVLKTKDKKARKEIKELRAEVKDLKKAFKILGKIAMVNKSFASTVDVHKLSRFVNNGL